MIRPVFIYPHPILRKKSEEITDFTGPIAYLDHMGRPQEITAADLATDLMDTMDDQEGLGLSAIQIGIPLRMIALARAEPLVLANPVITHTFGAVNIEEGCLSFPEIFIKAHRSTKVHLDCRSLDGARTWTHVLLGVEAQAAQHECDHLDGTLLVDHVSPLTQKLIDQRMRRYIKQVRKTGRVLARDKAKVKS